MASQYPSPSSSQFLYADAHSLRSGPACCALLFFWSWQSSRCMVLRYRGLLCLIYIKTVLRQPTLTVGHSHKTPAKTAKSSVWRSLYHSETSCSLLAVCTPLCCYYRCGKLQAKRSRPVPRRRRCRNIGDGRHAATSSSPARMTLEGAQADQLAALFTPWLATDQAMCRHGQCKWRGNQQAFHACTQACCWLNAGTSHSRPAQQMLPLLRSTQLTHRRHLVVNSCQFRQNTLGISR